MDPLRKGSLAFGILLVAFGAISLVIALLPGHLLGQVWPGIFYVIAAAFYLLIRLWPDLRKWLAALFIPGSIFLTLGLIFTYNVLSQDWNSWAYAWLLILSGVGVGLALAGAFGGWGRGMLSVGLWMIAIPTGLFGLFAALFGTPLLKIVGAVIVLLVGALLLIRSQRKG